MRVHPSVTTAWGTGCQTVQACLSVLTACMAPLTFPDECPLWLCSMFSFSRDPQSFMSYLFRSLLSCHLLCESHSNPPYFDVYSTLLIQLLYFLFLYRTHCHLTRVDARTAHLPCLPCAMEGEVHGDRVSVVAVLLYHLVCPSP